MRRLAALAVGGAALLLSACGTTGNGSGGIDRATNTQLQQDVLALSQAVAAHDHPAEQAALAALNADLAAARAAGKLTDGKLGQIRAATARVQADLSATAAVPRATVTLTPSVPPSKDNRGKGHGDGGGHSDGGGDGG